MALTRRHLNTIYDIIDEFYPALAMLRQYKHDEDAPFGFIMCVTVRAKIYESIQDLINRYKRGQDYTIHGVTEQNFPSVETTQVSSGAT